MRFLSGASGETVRIHYFGVRKSVKRGGRTRGVSGYGWLLLANLRRMQSYILQETDLLNLKHQESDQRSSFGRNIYSGKFVSESGVSSECLNKLRLEA